MKGDNRPKGQEKGEAIVTTLLESVYLLKQGMGFHWDT